MSFVVSSGMLFLVGFATHSLTRARCKGGRERAYARRIYFMAGLSCGRLVCNKTKRYELDSPLYVAKLPTTLEWRLLVFLSLHLSTSIDRSRETPLCQEKTAIFIETFCAVAYWNEASCEWALNTSCRFLLLQWNNEKRHDTTKTYSFTPTRTHLNLLNDWPKTDSSYQSHPCQSQPCSIHQDRCQLPAVHLLRREGRPLLPNPTKKCPFEIARLESFSAYEPRYQ